MKNFSVLLNVSLLAIFFVSSCKKDSITHGNSPSILEIKQKDSVGTPLGWLPKSRIYLIENGNHLEIRDGHVLKINNSNGLTIKDLGLRASFNYNVKGNLNKGLINGNKTFALKTPDPTALNWQTYSQWNNPSGQTISYFSTTYTVPVSPVTTTDGQLIFIFNGLQQAQFNSDIMQPVLQWGTNSAAGGGTYWGIANWYGWLDANNNQYFAISPLIQVSSGTVLTGIINNTGTKTGDGSYNYTSSFAGSYNNSLTIIEGTTASGTANNVKGTVTYPDIKPELWAFETLEVYNSSGIHNGYGPVQASDYPAASDIQMNNIKVMVNNVATSVSWNSEIGSNAYFGEHTDIVNNNSSGSGEVDLYFHQQVPVVSYTTPNTFTASNTIAPLNPSNNGGAATSYSVSPALPAGLSISPSSGVISGTPTTATAAANYIVTATNSAGSGTFTINITVNPSPKFSYDFQVTTEGPSSSMFHLTVNGVNVSNTVQTAGYNSVKDIYYNVLPNTNSTIVLTIDQGYMPKSANLHTYLSGGIGTISGSTITWTGIEIVAKQPSLSIVLN